MAPDAPDLAGAVDLSQVSGTPEGEAVIPSVMAITQRYLVHGVNLTPTQEDGSRELALHSRGGTLIEASLGPDVIAHLKAALNDELPEPEKPAEEEKAAEPDGS